MNTFQIITALRCFVCATCIASLSLSGPLGLAQAESQAQAKIVYTLCGGSCSRSMVIVATYEDLASACQAAEKLRETKPYVGLLTGKAVNPWLVLPTFRQELQPESCSVVTKSLRCGNWFIAERPKDRKTAETLVHEIRKSGRSAEVIYHLPNEG